MNQGPRPTLVLGGTGKTGRKVAERLTGRGVPVRVASRAGTTLFDWTDEATWRPAVHGAEAAYLSFYPDISAAGAPEAVRAFADVAVEAGVRRLVLLSGRGEPEAQRAERLVQDAGAEWTVVRCSWFNQNFSENSLLDQIRAGRVVLPGGHVPEPFVDTGDIADVAVTALTGDGHAGEIYELTGPRMLTFAEATAEIARATGRDIEFVPVTLDEYATELKAQGLPDDLVAMLTFLFGEVMDGRNSSLTDGVERALHRAPRDFGDYAGATAATGVWDPA
ncbi:MAG: NAD(P)H-binding protein [Streptosporangiales bacterium]|nr:NAD(P)H-binding protein [Streptosporangiales bacterium]